MIDNLTNNPRKREPLKSQWWVPDPKEMVEKDDYEFLAPVRKFNASQKALFKKLVRENPGIHSDDLLKTPYICKDQCFLRNSSIALITKPIFTGIRGQCWCGSFVCWLDYLNNPDLYEKFLSSLLTNVAYENPFYQETQE